MDEIDGGREIAAGRLKLDVALISAVMALTLEVVLIMLVLRSG